jgi:hypothetical protein
MTKKDDSGVGDSEDDFISVPNESGLHNVMVKMVRFTSPTHATRAWFTTMSEFLKTEGWPKVGYEENMCQVTQNGHNMVLVVHIDDFVIACVLMLNGGPISWKSHRQDSVALSTSETEYMTVSLCDQEVVYIRVILRDFGVQQIQSTFV